MELTIVLSVGDLSDDHEVLETLESLPWSYSGIDLLVYSEDTSKLKEIISGEDIEGVIKESPVGVVFCETPEGKELHHTIGLEDTKTEGVMFLNSGDIIEDFQEDILLTGTPEPIGIPGLGEDGIPETVICHSSRMLPESYRGMIFKAQWLRDVGISKIGPDLPARICSLLSDKIGVSEYWGGWSEYDISESLSIQRSYWDYNPGLPEVLTDLWNSDELPNKSDYIRDLVWNRCVTFVANEISEYLDNDNPYIKYLYPASKLTVLN